MGRWFPRRVVVRGPSMVPALRDGDVVLACPWLTPRPGSVVLVSWSGRPGQLSVKRVAAREPGGWTVHGDNPYASTDSRELGPATVLAVIPARLWPAPRRFRPGTKPPAS
ncbi:S24 family peptidase [Tamaricihabitans halophyticus]|nr:S24 family peptidase [Tamaricihabitans halophyticus]